MAKNVCDAGGRRPAAMDLGNGLTEADKKTGGRRLNAHLWTKRASGCLRPDPPARMSKGWSLASFAEHA
jgi:hypothetical protein